MFSDFGELSVSEISEIRRRPWTLRLHQLRAVLRDVASEDLAIALAIIGGIALSLVLAL